MKKKPNKQYLRNDVDVSDLFYNVELEILGELSECFSRTIDKIERIKGLSKSKRFTLYKTEMLAELQQFKIKNKKKYRLFFNALNDEIDDIIDLTYNTSLFEQEKIILKAIKEKKIKKATKKDEEMFAVLNKKKLSACLKAARKDFEQAEYALLRTSNDKFREIIQKSQVYFTSGVGTLKEAVDLAEKDFLSNGLDCIQYQDGRTVNIASYSKMALRTNNTRAANVADSVVRQKYKIYTVLISSYSGCSPLCKPWQGKVYLDDINMDIPDSEIGKYPLLSKAVEGGLFHPNCQHATSTYFEGISAEPKEEKEETNEEHKQKQKINYYNRQQKKYERLETAAVDDKNKEKYKEKAKNFKNKADEIKK